MVGRYDPATWVGGGVDVVGVGRDGGVEAATSLAHRLLDLLVRTTTNRLLVAAGLERRPTRLPRLRRLAVPNPNRARSVIRDRRGRRRVPTPRMADLERRRIPQPLLSLGETRMDMGSAVGDETRTLAETTCERVGDVPPHCKVALLSTRGCTVASDL